MASAGPRETIAADKPESNVAQSPKSEEVEVISTTTDNLMNGLIDGSIIHLGKEDLTPDASKKLQIIAEKYGYKDLPVYITEKTPPSIKLIKTSVNAYFEVNFGAIDITPALAKRLQMPDDQDIVDMLKSGQLVDLRTSKKHADFVKECDALARKMGLKTPPAYYIDRTGTWVNNPSSMECKARTTKNGKNIVLVADAGLDAAQIPQKFERALIGHEMGHLTHGDTSAEGLASASNSKAIRR